VHQFRLAVSDNGRVQTESPQASLFDDGATDSDRHPRRQDGRRTFRVYTDGACSGNPGPGGWAWATAPDGAVCASGGEGHTTNQRMEIVATLRALEHFDEHEVDVVIVSDSTYVVKCFQDRWWEGWLSRGWKNSQRQPVANRDLWEPLISLVRRRGGVTFEWVKGHSGDPMNDLVDAMAVEESRKHSA